MNRLIITLATGWQKVKESILRIFYYSFAVALIGVIATSPVSANEKDVWRGWVYNKSVHTSTLSDEERADATAFLYGVRLGFVELSLVPIRPNGKALPRSYPSCDKSDTQCSKRRKVLEQLGEITLQTRVACVFNPDMTQQLPTMLVGLVDELVPLPSAGIWLTPLQTWRKAQENSARCKAIISLLQRALDGSIS